MAEENAQGGAAASLPTADAERLRFLADAGLALVSSLDYAAALQQVANLSLGVFCDYCIFDVFDEDGTSHRVAWAHSRPDWPRLQEIGDFAPPTDLANYPTNQVIRTGRPVFVPYTDDTWMRSITWSDSHLELMRFLNPSSGMWVPLSAHGTTVGTAIFAYSYSDSGKHHTELDLALGVELGRRAGLAVLHARQYEALQTSAAQLRDMADHQRVLINELNHRVKNTLAIVQAIASRTLRRGVSPEAANREFGNRLSALAGAHDILTREEWKSASVADVVAATVKAHEEDGAGRFDVRGDASRLDARGALSLAMALHELATNAVKYGALSIDGGSVSISWELNAAKPGEVVVRWQEKNGPPVVPPKQRGFGTQLIERQLGLDGAQAPTIEFLPDGVVCVLLLPAR